MYILLSSKFGIRACR